MAETRVGYPSHEHVLQVSGCHWTSTSSLPQGNPALLASASRRNCCMPICSKSQVAAGRWEGHEPRFYFGHLYYSGGLLASESRAGSELLWSASHDQREAE